MNISIEQYRAAVGGFNILKCVSKGLYYYTVPDVKFNCVYYYTGLIIFMLLIISVDIHVHPGPVYKTTYLGLCHANMRSLVSDRSKLDDLKYIADSNNIDVITVSETWLNVNIPDCLLAIPGFQPILRQDRQVGCGGGVAVYCRDSLAVSLRHDLNDHCQRDVSNLWIEIHIGPSTVLVGTYYRPPGQPAESRNNFMDSLYRSITQAMASNPSLLLLLGDFNDRCHSWDSPHSDSELGLRLYNLIDNNGLKQIIDVHTRINDISNSLLDLIIVDSEQMIIDSGTLPPVSTSDHCVVYCHADLRVASSSSY